MTLHRVIIPLKFSLKYYYLKCTQIQHTNTFDTDAQQKQKYSESNFEIDNWHLIISQCRPNKD